MIHTLIFVAVYLLIGCFVAGLLNKMKQPPNKIVVLFIIAGWPIPMSLLLYYFFRIRFSGK